MGVGTLEWLERNNVIRGMSLLRCPALSVATVGVALGLALAGSWSSVAAATSARATYGSGWSRFEAGFPVTPQRGSSAQLKQLMKQYPEVTGVAIYYATHSTKNIFRTGAPVPAPPTEAVVVIHFSRASPVPSLVGELKKVLPKAKAVKVNGFSGLRFVSSTATSPIAKGSTISDPKSFLGVLILGKGGTLFEADAIETTAAGASAFLTSVKPIG